jgi:hypothetical protein
VAAFAFHRNLVSVLNELLIARSTRRPKGDRRHDDRMVMAEALSHTLQLITHT